MSLFLIQVPPKATGPSIPTFPLSEARSFAAVLDGASWARGAVPVTFVTKFAAGTLAKTGNQIQIRIWNANPSNSITITNAFIGNANDQSSGSPWDFDASGGTRLKFNGGNSVTLAPGAYGGSSFSDQMTFVTSPSKALIVAFDVPSNTLFPDFPNSGNKPLPTLAPAQGYPAITYYKDSVNEAGTTTKSTGYTGYGGGGAGVWSVWTGQS